MSLLEENLIFLREWLSTGGCFCAKVGSIVSTSPWRSRTSSGTDPRRPCSCCLPSLWVHMCFSLVDYTLFPWYPSFPLALNSFYLFFSRVPWTLSWDLMKRACLGLSIPRSHTLYIVWIWDSIFSHLLWEGASLMVAKQGTDVWV